MNRRVLLVDDEQNVLLGYTRILRKHAEVVTASGAVTGLQALVHQGPFAAVVADYQMPEVDGIEFLKRVQKSSPETTRMMLTGQTDLNVAMQAVNEGHIFRFLTKPCPYDVLTRSLDDAFRQYQLVTAEKELLEKTLKGSIKILVDLLALARPELFMRTTALTPLVRKVTERMCGSQNVTELALMFSRLSYLILPPQIVTDLQNGVSSADIETQTVIDQQPQAVRRMLLQIPRLEEVAEVVGYLRKKFDGGGQPADGASGDQIPLAARILRAILDFDDLKARGMSEVQAFQSLLARYGTYDPKVLEALKAEIELSHDGFDLVKVCVEELEPGMVMADNVVTVNGVILLREGIELTELFLQRIVQYNRLDRVVIPIRIWKKRMGK